MSSLDLMTHQCNVQRNTQSNADGVIASNWANTSGSPVACLIQEQNGQLQQTIGSQGLIYNAIAFLPAGTDIKPQSNDDNNDRIVMILPNRLAGTIYTVKLVIDESGEEDHLVAYLSRLPAP